MLRAAAALAMVAMGPTAHAATPPLSAERYVYAHGIAGEAASRLFELARALEPECPVQYRRWSFGPEPFPVAEQPLQYEPANRLREQLLKQTQARPGEFVFLSEQAGTPFAAAGVQRGDRLTPGPVAPAAGSGPALAPMGEFRAFSVADARRMSEALATDPQRRYTLWRGAQSSLIDVRAVPVCGMLFVPVDSRYAYAGAEGNSVHVTLPMLEALSRQQLLMVLAHEAAHVVLGSAPAAMRGGNALSALSGAPGLLGVVGALAKVRDYTGTNVETGVQSPGDGALIAADRLALRLLQPHGITAAEYFAFWERMSEASVPPSVPTYLRTRPFSDARIEALERAVKSAAAPAGQAGPPPAADDDSMRLERALAGEPEVPDSAAVSFKPGDRFTGPGVLTVGRIGSRKQVVLPPGEWVAVATADHPSEAGRVEMTSLAFARLAGARLAAMLEVTVNRTATTQSNWIDLADCERTDVLFRLDVPSSGLLRSCGVTRWSAHSRRKSTPVNDGVTAALRRMALSTTGPTVATTWMFEQRGIGYMRVRLTDWPLARPGPAPSEFADWTGASPDTPDARGAYLRELQAWSHRYQVMAAKGFDRALPDDDLAAGQHESEPVRHGGPAAAPQRASEAGAGAGASAAATGN
ncbi:MAG: M48 family metalloprotease [Burkholderiales bacterium]|nr:M48 family metalloprotease [Burkholderiales bacterium]